MLASLDPLMSHEAMTSHKAMPCSSNIRFFAAIDSSSVKGRPLSLNPPSFCGTGSLKHAAITRQKRFCGLP